MEEEVEGEPALSRGVVLLQACIRGYLVRKKFQSLKGEYESIVKEIEGNLDQLEWIKHPIPRPTFLSKSVLKPTKVKQLRGQAARFNVKNDLHNKEEKLYGQEGLQSRSKCSCEIALQNQFPTDVAAEVEVCDTKQTPEHPADEPFGRVLGESEEVKDCSNISSEWSSTILEMGSPRLSQELCFQKVQEIPQTLPDLERYRKNLAMELLWLQQAIVSRKNYLNLKQRLGSPE